MMCQFNYRKLTGMAPATMILIAVMIAGLAAFCRLTAEPCYAADEKVTVGKVVDNAVKKMDSISLGEVDLAKTKDDTTVRFVIAIQLEKSHSFYYDDFTVIENDPVGGTFTCGHPTNVTSYKRVTCEVKFDPTWLTAGKYTGIISVPFDNKVVANGGVYKCEKNGSGEGYQLLIPVSITLKGTNPRFLPAVKTLSAEAWNSAVEISWTPPREDCTTFKIFRRDGKDALPSKPELDKYVYLGTISTEDNNDWLSENGFSGTIFSDYYAENGKTYSYIIISGAYTDTPYSGNPSRSITAMPKASLRKKPAAPYYLDFKSADDGIGLTWSWNEVSGHKAPGDSDYEPQNETGEGEVDHFNIYQNGKLVKIVPRDSGIETEYNGHQYLSWETRVKTNEFYVPFTFYVTAVAPDGTESLPSKMRTTSRDEDGDVQISDYHIFYMTENVYDKVDSDKIVATYTGLYINVSMGSLARLDVWRKPAGASDSNYEKIDLVKTPEGRDMDTGVKKGKVYTYKIIAVVPDGRESDPLVVTVAADEGDWQGAPGGYGRDINFRTADGKSAKIKWSAYTKGTYRLYRDGKLIKSWVDPDSEIEYADDPGEDGRYEYYVTWTSKTYPDVVTKSNRILFIRDTADPDPDTFGKAPGKPKLIGRVLGYETSNWLQMMWSPSDEGGTPDGYVIYRTDGGIPNTSDWDNSRSWYNPKRNDGEKANGRFWCTYGDVYKYQMYQFKNEYDDTISGLNPHKIWIVAYNEVGYSEPSNVLEYVSTEDGLLPWDTDDTAPGAPEDVTAYADWAIGSSSYNPLDLNGRLYVTWSAPASGGDVDHYDIEIYHPEYKEDDLTVSEDTEKITVEVGQDQKCSVSLWDYYVGLPFTATVKAVNTKGETAAEPVTTVVTSKPAINTEAEDAHSVKVSWEGLLGKEKETVKEYRFYRRANSSKWELVRTIPYGEPGPDDDWAKGKYYGYYYIDTGLEGGMTYEYYVDAVDNNGVSHKSSTSSATLNDMNAPLDAPTNLSAKIVDGDVILSWTPSLAGGVPAYYRLYYQLASQDPDHGYWYSKDLDESFGPSTGAVVPAKEHNSYDDEISGIIKSFGGQSVRMYIKAIPAGGYGRDYSGPSNTIEVTWPTEDEIKIDKYPPQPITPEAEAGDGKVTLRWKKRTKLNAEESEATYYQVLKTWGSDYGVVATFPADKDSYEWVDTDVVNGEKYTYELRPCSSYYYSYYSYRWWYHQWCYMHSVIVVPNGKTKDQKVAENISAFADELLAEKPASMNDITEEYHEKVMELRESYEATTEYQRRLIGKDKCSAIEDLINEVRYHDAEVKYAADAKLTAAIGAIDALDTFPVDIGLDDEDFDDYEQAVKDSRAAYRALPDDAKALVSNLGKLLDHEARIRKLRRDAADRALAESLSDRMEALVTENISAETLTDELERGIKDLRWEYDAMTKAQKALVRDAALTNLEAAEEKLAIINGAEHKHKMRYMSAVAPTCTEGGNIAYYKCTGCGKCFTDADGRQAIEPADVQIPADPAAHDWDEWKITADANCTEGGTEERVCKNDASHKESRTLQAYGHEWDSGVITKEATPEEDGTITFTCKRCGSERTARIEIGEGACANTADHVWGEEELLVKATCSAPGQMKSVCTRCGIAIKYETQIDPLAHEWGDWDVTKDATCVDSGSRKHTCETCGTEKTEIIPATDDHSWDEGTLVRRASANDTGLIVHVCDICSDENVEVIPAVKASVKLSAKAYTWNGKAKKPAVTVINNGAVFDPTLYTVTYPAGRKNVGKYTVTVSLTGNYIGTVKASFKINPKGTSLTRVTGAKRGFTAKWKKQKAKMSKARVTGYQVQCSMSKKFKKSKTTTVKGWKKTSGKVTKLKAKKTYYVRVRTFTKVGSAKYYSTWSKYKKVKTK